MFRQVKSKAISYLYNIRLAHYLETKILRVFLKLALQFLSNVFCKCLAGNYTKTSEPYVLDSNKHANDDSADVKSDIFLCQGKKFDFSYCLSSCCVSLKDIKHFHFLGLWHAECEYLFSYKHDGKKSNILYLNITSHFSYSKFHSFLF